MISCGSSETPGPASQSEPASSPAQSKLDACALISKADAEGILGESVQEPRRGLEQEGTATSAALSQCTYEAAGGKMIGLMVRRSPGSDNTAAAIANIRQEVTDAANQPQDVAGLGDTAFWSQKQLHIFKGGSLCVLVTLFGIDDDSQALDQAKVVAEKALAKL